MTRPFLSEEPPAELRAFARVVRNMYVALQHEGFTATEALQIVGMAMASSLGGGKK